ncbi:MAG: response regulator transcription factor [Lachnospiraceae bacterium]|nr:response regulator transcription factor [Lachnospiraceae bacterium]
MLDTINCRVAICDDDDYDIEKIRMIIDDYQYDKNIDFKIDLYKSAEELLEKYVPGYYMVLILDVELTGMDGIELAKTIRALPDKDVCIIYVSSHPQYMSGAFDVRAFNYVQKTIYSDEEITLMHNKLFRVLDNAFENMNQSESLLKIKTDLEEDTLFKIKDIIAISSENKKESSVIIRYAGKDIIGFDRVKNLYESLKDQNFVYISRWRIVNLLHIHVINKESVLMDDGSKYELSRHYKNELNRLFSDKVLSI